MKYKIAQVFMVVWSIPILITAVNTDTFNFIDKSIGLGTGFTMLGLSLLWLKR